MPGTSPDRRTARARLARCVAVAAVLFGLLLLPCADGMMTTGGPMADGATAAMAVDGAAMATAQSGNGIPGGGMGGVLAACLVFLAAVVTTVLGLRPTWPRTIVPILTRAAAALSRAIRPRAPSLAELCLLRT